jgi:hypothetical protein
MANCLTIEAPSSFRLIADKFGEGGFGSPPRVQFDNPTAMLSIHVYD